MPASLRERYTRRPPPSRLWRVLLALGVLAAIGYGAAELWQRWRAGRVTLAFAGEAGAPLELTFFPEQLAFAQPSPPSPLGRLTAAADASTTVGRDLVPGAAVVRYAAPGIGTGYRHVRLGTDPAPIPLRAAGTVRGRVVEPIAAWSQGWRCAALRSVADAEVLVMGGGEHGVELARGTTDADGVFSVGGFDRELDGLGLRVRAPGFALGHVPLRRDVVEPTVALAVAAPLRGRVVAPAGVDPTTLRVLARNMPGVECTPQPDGAFVLDHVPPPMQPRLLLHGLPRAWTHASVRARQDVRIEVVAAAELHGQVLDRTTGEPLGGAMVFCGDDHAVLADGDGRFELTQLPPGQALLEVRYDWRDGRRLRSRQSSRPVLLRAGEVRVEFVVHVD